MKKILMVAILLLIVGAAVAQPMYVARNGNIQFFSTTPIEDIKAINKKVYSSLNTRDGVIQFLVIINQFQFKRSAMQDHFNDEDYMDSEKYPRSEFKGNITNLSEIDFSKNGTYVANIEGQLSMHGVTRTIKMNGNFTVNNGKFTGTSKFPVRLEDYNIKVPKIVFKKIAEEVEVTVNCQYLPYKK